MAMIASKNAKGFALPKNRLGLCKEKRDLSTNR